MATYNEIVSRIELDFNALQKDVRIPRRYILKIFKDTAEFFIAQKLYDKSLFREMDMYKWIKCVKFKPDNYISCGKFEFKRCKNLMKSVKKVPKILSSKFGYAVLLVTNLDNTKTYKVITMSDYINMSNRPHFDKFKGKYVIFDADGYLYIPDSEIKALNMLVITLDEKSEEYGDCDEKNDCADCINYWDMRIDIPAKLSELIYAETFNKVARRLNIPKDENDDLDSNRKTQTIQ